MLGAGCWVLGVWLYYCKKLELKNETSSNNNKMGHPTARGQLDYRREGEPGGERRTGPATGGSMSSIRAVKLARMRSCAVRSRCPTTTKQPAELLVEVAVTTTCELVVGALANPLVQHLAYMPDTWEEQAPAHDGRGELHQAAKQVAPLDVDAPECACHERLHAA